MAGDTHRGRRPSSMRSERPSAQEYATRVIPIPEALVAIADACAAARQLRTQNTLQYLFDCVRNGEVESVYTEGDREEDFTAGFKIQGKWYRLRIQILPEGDACV